MSHLFPIPEWLYEAKNKAALQTAPAWFTDFQQSQWNQVIKQGLPTRSDERWKYADLSFLAKQSFSLVEAIDTDRLRHAVHQHRLQQGESILLVFVNGCFAPELSDGAKLPANVIACSLNEAMQTHAEFIKTYLLDVIDAEKYPLASLNTALTTNGFFFYLPDDCKIEIPIHLLSLTIGEAEWMAHPQRLFLLGKQSQITIVEEYFARTAQAYLLNTVTSFILEKEAKLEHYKLQTEGQQAIHVAHTFIQQKQDSDVSFTYFSSSGLFARDEVIVTLQETGANCRTSGFYQSYDDKQYKDYHIEINHLAPQSHSEMLFKGIVDRHSRAVFNGRLHVAKAAQKILAYQANHHLLLSDEAEVYAKPELEIYADDVKCKHGATTGQLDQAALFYLRARGIPPTEAKEMLLAGFAEEIMQRVTHPGIKMRVQELVSQ